MEKIKDLYCTIIKTIDEYGERKEKSIYASLPNTSNGLSAMYSNGSSAMYSNGSSMNISALNSETYPKDSCEKNKSSLILILKDLKDSLASNSEDLISKQFKNLLINFSNTLDSVKENIEKVSNQLLGIFPNNFLANLQSLNYDIKNLINDAKRVNLLSNMAKVNTNIIIVGKNGSGKTTLVNSLASGTLTNITVIPAQKILYFNSYNNFPGSKNIEEYRERNLVCSNNTFKSNDMNPYDLISPFSAMITALVNDDIAIAYQDRNNYEHKDDTLKRSRSEFDRVKEIWQDLIPEINFKVSVEADWQISACKDEEEYPLNSLSDGEKCILYYICNVVMAREGGYVVVDEPDTFLNPAAYNSLWDRLISERPDCQFIFTSHNQDFIAARENTTLVWCRNFSLKNGQSIDNPELRILDNDIGSLPVELVTELVGSRKPILFCEGTKDSYDYRIYSKIFDCYIVRPVGGHNQVIQYTKTFNDLPEWAGNSAKGIIDNDGMTEFEEEKLKNKKICCLPYNEIEMLFFDEEVISKVLRQTLYTENEVKIKEIIKNFKSELINAVNQRKETVVFNIVKNRVDYELQSGFIDSSKVDSTEKLRTWAKKMPEKLNIDSLIKEVRDKLDTVLNEKNYSELLKFCNLKGEISKGLANKEICKDYVKHATARISVDNGLKEYIQTKINLC